jgi:hypothetical protein
MRSVDLHPSSRIFIFVPLFGFGFLAGNTPLSLFASSSVDHQSSFFISLHSVIICNQPTTDTCAMPAIVSCKIAIAMENQCAGRDNGDDGIYLLKEL